MALGFSELGELNLDRGKMGVSSKVIEAVNTDIDSIVSQLKDDRYPVESRKALHEEYGELMLAGYQLTNHADIEWVPPAEDPSSDEMAESLQNLNSHLNEDEIRKTATIEDIESVRDSIIDFIEQLDRVGNFQYAFKEEEVESKYGRYVQSVGLRDDVDPSNIDGGDGREIYAGPRARMHLEQKPREAREVDNYEIPLFLGTGTKKGKDSTIPKDTLYRHTATVGVTGYGKSTLLTNNQKQLIEAGAGLCFIDPKGDDSERLAEIIPDDRKDDLIWIEPGSSTGKVSGFNFINVGLPPNHPHIETAVSALVSDLKKMLGAGEYWGPRMDRVSGNIIRAMNVYNRQNPEEPDLNLADLYYVLLDPRSRHEFATLVRAEGIDFIEDYTEIIAEMEDDNLEPILGRMQPWIESPIARRMICFRDSNLNIPQAVSNNKIIVVRMGGQPEDLKQMLGMAVVRRIWATIRSRAEQDEHERQPFYMFVDEAHNIALADNTFPKMLAEARGYRLSLNIATQYLSQLPENVVRGIRVNCDTIMSFNAGSQDEARKISPQMGLDPETLINEGRFHIWTRMADPETGELTDPFKVYIHPPFPPHRTASEAEQLIQKSLDKYGREKLTPKERKQRLQFFRGNGEAEIGVGEEILRAQQDPDIPPEMVEEIKQDAIHQRRKAKETTKDDDDTEEGESSDNRETVTQSSDLSSRDRLILESLYAARVKAGKKPGEPITIDRLETEIEARKGDDGYGSKLANDVEALSNYIELGTHKGDESLKLTSEGRSEVFTSTGDDPTGGFIGHRRILRQTFEIFTRLGYQMSLPNQKSGEEKPDGIAETPFDPSAVDAHNKTAQQLQDLLNERMEHLEEAYPHVAELSRGRTVRVETETTTQLKPAQVLTNLRKSINDGCFTAFVTKDAFFSDDDRVPDDVEDTTSWWGRYIERAIYDREYNPTTSTRETLYGEGNIILARETDENGHRTFYNGKGEYRVGSNDSKALRPAPDGQGRTTWRETDDGIVAEDSDNGVFAEFDSPEAVAEGDPSAVPAYYQYDQSEEEYIVREGGEEQTYGSKEEIFDEWDTFRAPFLPEIEFESMPSADDFCIIVLPNVDNPLYNQPLFFDHGETKPLYDELDIDPPEHALIKEEHQHEIGESAGTDGPEITDNSSASTPSQTTATEGEDGDIFDELDLPDLEGSESGDNEEDQPENGESETEPEPAPSGPEYAFPQATSKKDLPDACPDCGGDTLEIAYQQPFIGPATTLDNFPSICASLSDTSCLDMSTQPPRVTEKIEATVVSCTSCPLTATVYFPKEEINEEEEAASEQSEATHSPEQRPQKPTGTQEDSPSVSQGSPNPQEADVGGNGIEAAGEDSGSTDTKHETDQNSTPTETVDTDDDAEFEAEDSDQEGTDEGDAGEELPSVDLDDETEEEFFSNIDSWDHREG